MANKAPAIPGGTPPLFDTLLPLGLGTILNLNYHGNRELQIPPIVLIFYSCGVVPDGGFASCRFSR